MLIKQTNILSNVNISLVEIIWKWFMKSEGLFRKSINVLSIILFLSSIGLAGCSSQQNYQDIASDISKSNTVSNHNNQQSIQANCIQDVSSIRDVSRDDPYYKALEFLVGLCVLQPFPGMTFRGGMNVQSNEFAKLASLLEAKAEELGKSCNIQTIENESLTRRQLVEFLYDSCPEILNHDYQVKHNLNILTGFSSIQKAFI